ncbi:LOW QUALITY PROTEIN: hypothetical protein PanWU01x14_153760 [Parasponia andersonii]|uniref:Uncharacterized protein n=1 Tax=Parasponia andersonii TaxID=3476 RepID=A0A2P5CH79_PARAD|nr:LOW QUALITY PROTEIN: hypothetical protein PanWU01x14_153760 [Parasponia andersonii]
MIYLIFSPQFIVDDRRRRRRLLGDDDDHRDLDDALVYRVEARQIYTSPQALTFSSVFHRKRLACQIMIKSFSSVFPRTGLQAHTYARLAVHRKGLAVVAKKVVLAETLL